MCHFLDWHKGGLPGFGFGPALGLALGGRHRPLLGPVAPQEVPGWAFGRFLLFCLLLGQILGVPVQELLPGGDVSVGLVGLLNVKIIGEVAWAVETRGFFHTLIMAQKGPGSTEAVPLCKLSQGGPERTSVSVCQLEQTNCPFSLRR